MSKKRLKSIHALAFDAQSGRCSDCGLPMWLVSSSALGLKASKADGSQSTA